jgi:hypothetical protein
MGGTDGSKLVKRICFVCNWCSSPILFDMLLEAGTNILGTVRLNQKQMPQDPKNVKIKKA